MIKLFLGSCYAGRDLSNGKTIIKLNTKRYKDIVFRNFNKEKRKDSFIYGNDLKAAATDCLKNVQKLNR
jgi:hypothetical protein